MIRIRFVSRLSNWLNRFQNKVSQQSNQRLALIILVITLGIHGLYSLTHISFLQDSARDVMIAEQHLADGEYIVSYGPKASVGNFYLPPFYYQLQLWLVALLPSFPLSMQFFITIVESFTPVLLFFLFRLYLPKKASLLLSLLYAVFHQVLLFSSSMWNPVMIPFFTTLFIVSWLYFFKTLAKKYLYIGSLALAIALHLHYQTFVLLPFAVVIWIYTFYKYKKVRIDLIAAALLASVTFWPYLKAELISSFSNSQGIYTFFSQEHTAYYDRVSKPAYIFTYFPAFFERLMFSAEQPFKVVGRLIFFGGFASGAWYFLKKKPVAWLMLYFGSIILMLRVFKGDKLDYYLMTLFILPIILLSWISLISKKLAVGLGLVIISLVLFYSQRLPIHNNYTDLKKMVTYIDENTETNAIQFIFHDLSLTNYFYFGMVKFGQKQMARQSTDIVDICPIYDGSCAWDGLLMCKSNSLAEEELLLYSIQPKIDNDYQLITRKKFDDKFVVVVGRVHEPRALGTHPQQHDVNLYGSDFLIQF